MKPSIGRITHYVNQAGEHYAAIVTAVHFGDSVSLAVFPPAAVEGTDVAAVLHRERVPHDESGRPGSWHWPERVD